MAPKLLYPLTLLALILNFSYATPRFQHSLEKRGLVTPNTLPTNWTYSGCYNDTTNSRALTSGYYSDGSAMTDESCIAYCSSNKYGIAGVEYSQQCCKPPNSTKLLNELRLDRNNVQSVDCGNILSSGSTTQPSTDCNMACTGNSSEACGGSNRLTVFENPYLIPANDPGPAGWTLIGCYTDQSTRTLSTGYAVTGGASNMTVANCVAVCGQNSQKYAGMEYADECYCGNTFNGGGGPAPDNFTECSMTCSGNSSEYCGGSNRLSMYQAPGTGAIPWKFSSSSSSSSTVAPSSTKISSTAISSTTIKTTSSSASPTSTTAASSTVPSSTSIKTSSSIATPSSTAPASSTKISSTSTVPSSTASITSKVASLSSSSPSASASSTIISSASTPSTASKLSSVGASSIASASATSTSTAGGLPPGWSYKGCYIDNANGRVLPDQLPDNSSLTEESCSQSCYQAGYSVSGAEYGVQCFCGNAIYDGGALASSDSQCNMACGGNAAEICGAGNRLSVYSNATITTYAVAAAQTSGLPGSWTYTGCYNEAEAANNMKVLPYEIIQTNNNSAKTCLGLCSAFGYPVGGMEYGDECYCGDPIDITNAGSTKQPDSSCNMACSGDPRYNCGAGNLLSLYTWTGTPLYTWHTPTGAGMGAYELLIGGVVVPLMTSQTITGKVTFLEKHGTSLAANSTGAYELDPTQVNNFTAAWRTMNGLKTDVFCSAGLTLPDKVGRQIDVGGWSLTSTFGVRLYWPGGPANDWQENANEVFLQDGRWYPSAMIMANGSILVVGGESGSNGPPVPTLEVLPFGGPPIYLDFLNRTDPNNLYPYLAVLPSGGIFIAYYNEARVLDAGTFATTKTLPNIPGAVNNFLGGRSYPLEGTMVLMPQYPPYTAPLTILICGGSTPYQGQALDNCVSTQPEAASPEWTLERMPSARVMSCISTLPDGTYLILNGALAGQAGFGLATVPNLDALLYDPTQPVGARFSIMNTTIVARLYHSEAILLQDGRVMVSGSDPEDNGVNPEEYRVEVFIPPYLLSGLPRPNFTISNTDWTYGASVPITIVSGSTANLRVSLVGAESSTHGNSMGQRIFFPAVSCSGKTCTITAPPNAHVCPPGWFQLFVLDGPTPSHSTYVRIGGDPADLGNWPNFPDFNIPGE